MYIKDTPQTTGVHLALLADDTGLYATERKEDCALRKLQNGLKSMVEWSKHWNIKINEDKTEKIYFSHPIRPPKTLLTLNGWNIPFVNNVKYLCVTFDRKITWILHIKTIETKAFRPFIRTYSLFKSE
jgi:hypothetical protein